MYKEDKLIYTLVVIALSMALSLMFLELIGAAVSIFHSPHVISNPSANICNSKGDI